MKTSNHIDTYQDLDAPSWALLQTRASRSTFLHSVPPLERHPLNPDQINLPTHESKENSISKLPPV